MPEEVDYEYKPEGAGSGKFLNLKTKGDKVTIRLCSKPIAYFVHWIEGKPQNCEGVNSCPICKELASLSQEDAKKEENAKKRRRQTFIWPVIDRSDGQAKIYKSGVSVFLAIAELAVNPKWGGPDKDATRFDLEITRTEASLQNFYSIVPDPTSLGKELTEEEKKAAEELRPVMDTVSIMALESTEVETVPSKANPSNPDDFIKGLEEDRKKEEAQASDSGDNLAKEFES
jgi:hypothetical protein